MDNKPKIYGTGPRPEPTDFPAGKARKADSVEGSVTIYRKMLAELALSDLEQCRGVANSGKFSRINGAPLCNSAKCCMHLRAQRLRAFELLGDGDIERGVREARRLTQAEDDYFLDHSHGEALFPILESGAAQ